MGNNKAQATQDEQGHLGKRKTSSFAVDSSTSPKRITKSSTTQPRSPPEDDEPCPPETLKNPKFIPRAAYYTKAVVQRITRDTKGRDADGKLTFDKLKPKSHENSCYIVGLVEAEEDIDDDSLGVHLDGLYSLQLSRMRDVLGSKLSCLDESLREEAEHELQKFDGEVLCETNKIADAQREFGRSSLFLLIRLESYCSCILSRVLLHLAHVNRMYLPHPLLPCSILLPH